MLSSSPQVHRLYELGQYKDVVDVLLNSLHHPPPMGKIGNGGMSIPERPAQLLLLQDSLFKIEDYKVRFMVDFLLIPICKDFILNYVFFLYVFFLDVFDMLRSCA